MDTDKTIVITNSIHREYATDIIQPLLKEFESKLTVAVKTYEPETENYLNGTLDVWVEIKLHHEPYNG